MFDLSLSSSLMIVEWLSVVVVAAGDCGAIVEWLWEVVRQDIDPSTTGSGEGGDGGGGTCHRFDCSTRSRRSKWECFPVRQSFPSLVVLVLLLLFVPWARTGDTDCNRSVRPHGEEMRPNSCSNSASHSTPPAPPDDSKVPQTFRDSAKCPLNSLATTFCPATATGSSAADGCPS